MKTLADMKRRSDGELTRLLKHVRFDLGTHKRTKLKRCGYKRWATTLLDEEVAKKHADRLFDRYFAKWGRLLKSEENKRLRFLTVLGSVEKLDAEAILRGVESLERDLRRAMKPIDSIDVLGAIEIEIFKLSVLEQIASADNKNEQRKLMVLTAMMPPLKNNLYERDAHDPSYALIHVHALVDLGDGKDETQDKLQDRLKKQFPGAYRVELKQTFDDRRISRNLRHIANYLTKGGNDTLRYNAKFGRDNIGDEWLEHTIWRQGGQGDKTRNTDPDASVEDSRSMSVTEIGVLAQSVDKLMDRAAKRDGYIFKWNDLSRYRLGRR